MPREMDMMEQTWKWRHRDQLEIAVLSKASLAKTLGQRIQRSGKIASMTELT